MSEREWIDAADWNLRHSKPGATVREASWGAVATDEDGAVTQVSGRVATGRKKDLETGLLAPFSVQGEPPTREDLLENGYLDRAEFPLSEDDLEYEPVKEPVKKATPAGGERKTAPTTHVEAHPRGVKVAPDGATMAPSGGEMGAPVDPEAGKAASEGSGDAADSYENPFLEGGVPVGTPASDPRHNPPEGAPAGEDVEDLVKSGRAEVLDT